MITNKIQLQQCVRFPLARLCRSLITSFFSSCHHLFKHDILTYICWNMKISCQLSSALFIYPLCCKIMSCFESRQTLGYLLLLSKEWNDSHLAIRCCVTRSAHTTSKEGFRSSCEILGAGAVACYAIGNSSPKFSYPTCANQSFNEPQSLQLLQKYVSVGPISVVWITNWIHQAVFGTHITNIT